MTTSFGNKLGRGIGVLGALAVEGTVRGATGLGAFGADVVNGAEVGYAEKHAALLVTRAAAAKARDARIVAAKAAHLAAMAPAVEITAKRTAKA
jgi:hypothetical protein